MSADVLGGGVAANTMHTYREPPSERRRRLKNSALLVAAVVIASGATVVVSAAHGTPGWQLARDIGATAAFVVVGAYLFRRHTNGVCTEIRLSDDGVCEFEMRGGSTVSMSPRFTA